MSKMSANATEELNEQFEQVSPLFIFIMRIIALSILCLNGTVIFCLYVKKYSVPRIYTLQIVCLCLTDNMAGAALLAMSFMDYDWFGTDTIRCYFLLGFFMSSQSASLYNVTAICINRFIIMLRMDQMDHHLTRTKVIAFSSSALIFGTAFCSVPFIFWGPNQRYKNSTGCSMEAVFRENIGSSIKVFFGTFLLPLLITNFLYGCLFFKIRRKQRQIRPDIHAVPGEEVPSNLKLHTKNQILIGSGRVASNNQAFGQIAGTANLNTFGHDTSMATTNMNKTRRTESDSKEQTGLNSHLGHTPVNKQSNANTAQSTSCTDAERRIYEDKAFTIIGFILLFLNICTWPGVIVLLMGSVIETWSLSRVSAIPLFCSISSNSVINPILYTVRLKEFRKVLCDMFLCSHSRIGFR